MTKCVLGGNDRDGDLRTRKMKLKSFVRPEVTITNGRDDLDDDVKDFFPNLGTTTENGELISIPYLLKRNSALQTQCHLAGTRIANYTIITLCDRYVNDTQIDFHKWEDISKQQFFAKCSNLIATSRTTFSPIMQEARNVLLPHFTPPLVGRFDGASRILDNLARSMLTCFKNHLKTNLHRFLKRDIWLHITIHFINNSESKASKSRLKKIAKQIFCVIVGIFNKTSPNLLKETEEHVPTQEYIKYYRRILGQEDDYRGEMEKLNDATKLVRNRFRGCRTYPGMTLGGVMHVRKSA